MDSADSVDQKDSEDKKRLPIEAAYQRQLMPIDVITSYSSHMGTADLRVIVEARDGKHYAVKTTADGAGNVPASELFCYELAYRVLIPTPSYAFISMPTEGVSFGSAWEGGVVNGDSKINYLSFIQDVLSGQKKIPNLKVFFSRLFAFDLFVNNVDRHWGNYLWRTSFNDSYVALAFDFSRACFELGHDGYHALSPLSKTQGTFRLLNTTKNYERSEAVACLEAIRAIPTAEVEGILANFPSAWMGKAKRREYIEWWNSEARQARIDHLLKLL
ncbi:hypothetical protein LOY42_16200 [Pseudomonas sp. B21-023]|uniref:HipA family kinase n=1 Tax=Pseudomonas sp. B21-023 TaxID=2895477 RepID=UPI00215E2A2F|nr:HipA family kinase [Pseudomonas sp. B21-023]UVM14835.1 hypothetical protein LOY42_16200 [Pseudomonas sp. B21-023]